MLQGLGAGGPLRSWFIWLVETGAEWTSGERMTWMERCEWQEKNIEDSHPRPA